MTRVQQGFHRDQTWGIVLRGPLAEARRRTLDTFDPCVCFTNFTTVFLELHKHLKIPPPRFRVENTHKKMFLRSDDRDLEARGDVATPLVVDSHLPIPTTVDFSTTSEGGTSLTCTGTLYLNLILWGGMGRG